MICHPNATFNYFLLCKVHLPHQLQGGEIGVTSLQVFQFLDHPDLPTTLRTVMAQGSLGGNQ